MDQTTSQPHGDFVAFVVRDKKPGDRKPTFDGRLSLPGHDAQLNIALWSHEYADPTTGEMKIMFNGRSDAVSPTDAPMDQVAALTKHADGETVAVGNLALAARQLVLFPNRFKDNKPDKERPDYWGAYNPGHSQPVVRISAWMRKDRYQHAMISGATSYPLPGKSEPEQQDLMTSVDAIKATVPVSKARAARSGR